jgi:hypothetical protein
MVPSDGLDLYCDPGLALRPLRDRRSTSRIAIPPCQGCGCPDSSVVTRTDEFLYAQCQSCSSIWTIGKPAPTSPELGY